MLSARRDRARFVLGMTTALVLAMAVVSLRSLPVLHPLDVLDEHVQDRFLLARNRSVPVPGFEKFYPHLVIIDIDDESLTSLGRWPWPRRVFARLFDRLRVAGVKVVASDILFTQESESPPGDEALAVAVGRLPHVVLGTLYRGTLGDAVQVDPPLPGSRALPACVIPASVGVTPGRDGVLRHLPMVVELDAGGKLLPALSVATYAAYRGQGLASVHLADHHQLRVANRMVPVRRGRSPGPDVHPPLQTRLDWPIPDLRRMGVQETLREVFPLCEVVPFHMALDLPDDEMRKLFGGRIALLGARAQAFKEDVKATPLGEAPGLVVHACAIISLLEGRFLTEWPHWVELGVFLALALLLSWIMGRVHPLVGLVLGVGACGAWVWSARWLFLEHGIVVGVAAPALNGIVYGVLLLHAWTVAARERSHIRAVLGGYLSPAVVDLLAAEERAGRLGLQGKKGRVTTFFSDIRGFTSFSEGHSPEEVVRTLNEYFTEIADVAVREGGYIDKYGGDSMMVVFSAPLPRDDDPVRAVRAAWEMQRRLRVLNDRWEAEGRPRLETGMGLVTGDAVMGNIGSPAKTNYTAIGDRVNLAARLCARAEGGQVLICAATREALGERFVTRELPPMQVKGKQEVVEVHEVLGERSQ